MQNKYLTEHYRMLQQCIHKQQKRAVQSQSLNVFIRQLLPATKNEGGRKKRRNQERETKREREEDRERDQERER